MKLSDQAQSKPIIKIFGSNDDATNQLIKSFIGSEAKLIDPSKDFNKNDTDYKIYIFSDPKDDKMLINMNEKESIVLCSETYPNKEILQSLGDKKKIKLYSTTDEIAKELLPILENFKKIGENMLGDRMPRTGNIFYWNGSGGFGEGRECPAIVTNNIKSAKVFNCIGLDDGTEQSYVPGNGDIEEFTLGDLKKRITKDRSITKEETEICLKKLKLRIAKMDKLSL